MARSILLVDDDPDIRVTLRDFLIAERFVVHTARDGQHALHLLDRIELPSLILLDYMMPVMNGGQFLTAMRRNARLRDIPVVLLSARTREWSGARMEVTEVLAKPVDLDLLLTTVRAICGAPAPAPAPAPDRVEEATAQPRNADRSPPS